ncbi:PAS domain S-box-containing protein [Breznakibacter xylanolyticus]|uniref:histidine kinase n=1 Tax=Breznakibacter xylanolyticus TaxID=990 RepID=A0A2W7MYM3_9BACT|nr:PAS domain-containing sensor histidine kinase [Breznakibacter xylanolyticus]PZX13048.1 PAS domain S-box-containing protein [Breznakibacter xylanolyticus]
MKHEHATYEELRQRVVELERQLAEVVALRQKSNEGSDSNTEGFYKHLFLNLNANFAVHEIIYDSHHTPIDYRFIDVNPAFVKAVGMPAEQIIGKTAKELFPDTEPYWVELFAKVAQTGVAAHYRNYSKALHRFYELDVFTHIQGQFAMLANDVTKQVISRREIYQAKQYFQQIFNLIPNAVILTRQSDGMILDVNNGYYNLLGYHPDEVIGKTTLNLNIWINPEERNKLVEALSHDGYCYNYEAQFRKKDGGRVTGMISSTIIKNQNGRCILSVCRDITDRKRMEEELRASEDTLKESQRIARVGSYRFDICTGLWLSSEILDQIFGIDQNFPHDVQGWLRIIHPDSQQEMSQYLKINIIENHEPFDREYRIIRQDTGEEAWVHGRGELIFDEQGLLKEMVGTIVDITTRKSAELIIQEQNKQLSELNAAKNKLFSIIAHDLRAPFNALLGLSDIVLRSYDDFNRTDIHQFITNINTLASQTFVLLENLLDWARLQSGLLSAQMIRCPLIEPIEQVCALSRELAANKQIALIHRIPEELMVTCDLHMTRTILRNLISNAVKYTYPGGQITIEATIESGWVIVNIVDTGIGIHPQVLSHLFDPDLYLTTEGTANEKGSGLGLPLCRELAEKQGGKLDAVSVPGKGSRFFFYLPKA